MLPAINSGLSTTHLSLEKIQKMEDEIMTLKKTSEKLSAELEVEFGSDTILPDDDPRVIQAREIRNKWLDVIANFPTDNHDRRFIHTFVVFYPTFAFPIAKTNPIVKEKNGINLFLDVAGLKLNVPDGRIMSFGKLFDAGELEIKNIRNTEKPQTINPEMVNGIIMLADVRFGKYEKADAKVIVEFGKDIYNTEIHVPIEPISCKIDSEGNFSIPNSDRKTSIEEIGIKLPDGLFLVDHTIPFHMTFDL